jgi:hypothetical protein
MGVVFSIALRSLQNFQLSEEVLAGPVAGRKFLRDFFRDRPDSVIIRVAFLLSKDGLVPFCTESENL